MNVPPGFLPVAGGLFSYGGDDEAYESLEQGREEVGDFFMARTEVTFGEYLEFINAPETLARLEAGGERNDEGKVSPLVDWSDGALRILRPPEAEGIQPTVDLLPRFGRTALLARRGAEFELADGSFSREWPVLGLSLFAGLEYARWLTERHRGRWRFRLPTDFEWEKAARGADRRPYVWGHYPLFSFAHSKLGSYPRGAEEHDLAPVGVHPMDESAYGILDLCGSVSEPVITDPSRVPYALRLVTIRGASWDATDERDFRIATRNRILPENHVRYVGLRLVATPGEE